MANKIYKLIFTMDDGTEKEVQFTSPQGEKGADGVGISNIEKTATNGKVDTYTITLTNGVAYLFTITNGNDGEKGDNGKTPYIQDGYWYIDGVNTGVKAEGLDGINGTNGVGISSIVKTSTSGLVDTYTITLTNGEQSRFTVTNGQNGNSVTITNVVESTEDGGSNVVTFSDGKTLTVKNGKDGQDGTGTSDNIEILLPSEAVAVVGVEFNIYWADIFRSTKSLDNYAFYAFLSDSSIKRLSLNECFRLTATAVGDYTLTIQALDRCTGATILSKTLTLHVIANSVISGKKGLVLGDSLGFSNGAMYSAVIQYELSSGGIQFIGTQTGEQVSNGLGAVNHECYNGATIKGFLSDTVVSGSSNPFYNPTTGQFDLDYYMTNQGHTKLDFIMINLGHNQLGNYNTITQFNTLISLIRGSSYGANIPIFIPLITTLGDQDGWRSGTNNDNTNGSAFVMRNHWWRHNANNISAFDKEAVSNVYLTTPYWACDPERMFKTETVARSARDTDTIIRQHDAMHPNTVALKQMSDAMYPYLLYHIPDTDVTSYSITSKLTNVTNSNSAVTVEAGSSYSATLTANSGYTLDTVTVTMGGSAVAVTDGIINIASVTGDIVITATATEIQASYTNLADPSKANDSSPNTALTADEWLNGYYISSKTISVKADIRVTNRIPLTYTDTIRITGFATTGTINGSGCAGRLRVLPCDANGNALMSEVYPAIAKATQGTGRLEYMDETELANGVYCFSPQNDFAPDYWTNVAFVRICGYPIDGNNENVIVTVNEPIV